MSAIRPAFTIGPHRLYLGDANLIRATLGRQDCDCMDPQYKFDNSGGGQWRKDRTASDQLEAEGLNQGFDQSIINPLLCGSVVVFFHPDQLLDLGAHMKGNFRRTVLLQWIKDNPAPHRNKNYLFDCEPYFHSWNEGFHPIGEHADMHRHVFAPVAPSKIYGHPTVKPEKVMDKIMANINGMTICDPFMGTGSTGVAAIKAGKIFTGIELNPKHFETAKRRIMAAFEAAK